MEQTVEAAERPAVPHHRPRRPLLLGPGHRRRGARARARRMHLRRAASVHNRIQRAVWDQRALGLPDPLLTADLAEPPVDAITQAVREAAELGRTHAIDLSDGPRLLVDEAPRPRGPHVQRVADVEPAPGPMAPADPHRLVEPGLITLLATVAALAAWTGQAPVAAWAAIAVLPVAGLVALFRPSPDDGARAVRAAAVLGVAAALPAAATSLTPVTLLVALSVVAVYPMIVGTIAGRVVTGLGAAALALPLAVEVVRSGPSAFLTSFTGAGSGSVATLRTALACGLVVVLLVGSSAIAARRPDLPEEPEAIPGPEDDDSLPGRDGLLHRAAGMMSSVRRSPGLALIEIDRFGTLADSAGEAAARAVADEVARRLREDVPATALLARTGAHQYAVVLPVADEELLAGLARDVHHLFEDAADDLPITCCVGTALAADVTDAEDLLAAADEALRAAQRDGRGRTVPADVAVRAHAHTQATLEVELRAAIAAGAIGAAFQPILALAGGDQEGDDRVVGAEALARWRREGGEDVPPERFVPLADDLGLGGELGAQMVRQGLEALVGWRAGHAGLDQVWVNMSAVQLQDEDLPFRIGALLRERRLAPSCLVIEVPAPELTEVDLVLPVLGRLRSLGVAVALSRFGRSGTSLSALRELPISAVKLDRVLAPDPDRKDAVARSVTDLCHSLGLRVVVEGVETVRQLRGAREVGGDAVQGFAIARPMSARDVLDLVTLRRGTIGHG